MNRSQLIKSSIFIAWLILVGLLIKRDVLVEEVDFRENQALERAQHQEFQGIYFKNKKIGYLHTSFKANSDQSFRIEQKGYMILNILESRQPLNLHLTANVGKENRLQDFTLSFKSPFYQMKAEGFVNGKQVSFKLKTNNRTTNDTISLPEPPTLSTTRRGYLLKEEMKPGDKLKIPRFDPITLTGRNSVLEYRGKEKILINNRIFNLHHFLERAHGARINIWLDDNGNVIKEESPAGFILIKEPEFKATRLDQESIEVLSAVSAQLIGDMIPVNNRQHVSYRLLLPEHHLFDLDGGRQSFEDGVVTINREDTEALRSSPSPSCPGIDSASHSTTYIQTDHPEITALRKKIIGTEKDPLVQVKMLAEWVYANIDKRPVVGLPDALTTLKNRVGDCNEHASLFAALAGNSGIPTRFVTGVTYLKESFYYHAWNEVCLGSQWVSLDTTMGQLPADLTHIRFITGGIKDQLRIGGLLGQLSIEIVQDDQSKKPSNNMKKQIQTP